MNKGTISTLIGTDKITKQEQNLKLFSGHFVNGSVILNNQIQNF